MNTYFIAIAWTVQLRMVSRHSWSTRGYMYAHGMNPCLMYRTLWLRRLTRLCFGLTQGCDHDGPGGFWTESPRIKGMCLSCVDACTVKGPITHFIFTLNCFISFIKIDLFRHYLIPWVFFTCSLSLSLSLFFTSMKCFERFLCSASIQDYMYATLGQFSNDVLGSKPRALCSCGSCESMSCG